MTSQEEHFRRLISLHRGNEGVLHCIVNHVCVTGSFTEIIIHVLLGELIFTVLSWYLAATGQRRQDRCKCWSILYICHWLFSGKCMVRDYKFGTRTAFIIECTWVSAVCKTFPFLSFHKHSLSLFFLIPSQFSRTRFQVWPHSMHPHSAPSSLPTLPYSPLCFSYSQPRDSS